MGRVLEVSTSGHCAWVKRPPPKRARQSALILERIETFHERSSGSDGAPRIHEDLKGAGIRVGLKFMSRSFPP